MSDTYGQPPTPSEPPAPGWWMASDGNYYPPEQGGQAPPAPSYAPYGPPAGGYPPAGGGYGYAPVQQTSYNGLAIASMVLGILWLYWVGSILALIFGFVALSQIKRSQGRQTGGGMAIAGVVLGFVGIGIGIIVLIIGIATVNTLDDYNSDTPNGVCNSDRYFQDPDC